MHFLHDLESDSTFAGHILSTLKFLVATLFSYLREKKLVWGMGVEEVTDGTSLNLKISLGRLLSTTDSMLREVLSCFRKEKFCLALEKTCEIMTLSELIIMI